jgi:S1-C subfamily serine protease
MNTALNQLSQALRSQVLAAQSIAVAIRNDEGRHITGVLWNDDVVVTSEQAVGARERYSILANGTTTAARVVGRDSGTNVLALRTDQPLQSHRPALAEAILGTLVTAFGATASGTPTVRLGIVNTVGPQWHSRAGGRIDARVGLDIRLARTEEGGPVLDTNGALLGMSTFGIAGEVLVIPGATIERVVPQLLQHGHVVRGWLGVGLQPIAIPDALRDVAGDSHGMIVMSIAADSPAAKGGVTAGDILLSLSGMPMHRMRHLAAELDSESIGKQVEVRALRGGQIVTLLLEISPRPTT